MMKVLLITALFICLLALYVASLYLCHTTDGFFDMTSDYTTLRTRVSTMMAPYCDLASYTQAQMKEIYMTTKPASLGGAETSSQANAHVQRTYAEVYACKDLMASSRQTCQSNSGGTLTNTSFIPCDPTYTKLPDMTGTNAVDVAIALNKIPDDLPDRINREVDWYAQIVTKLTEAFAQGDSPPGLSKTDDIAPTQPKSDDYPVTDSNGKAWSSDALKPSIEGFLNRSWHIEGFSLKEAFDGGTCSPAQAQAKIDLKKKEASDASAVSCTMPTLDTQIPRVNKILDSTVLQAALAKCAALKDAMKALKEKQQKAKDGTLYPWQQAAPNRTFVTLPSGNRTDGLLSSLKQNQM